MSNDILEVKSLYKRFNNYGGELKRILSWFGLPFKPKKNQQILNDININLSAGEAVGIIGKNGAGKSTLLKIITGVLQPSSGTVTVKGKVAAILELGMGFHPDRSGRQNAYHSAGLMGYTKEQIHNVMNDIEKFADIGEYFDYPARSYSSGMQVRVAFAVATAFRPEVLIVDEALSVGDATFQRKCFLKIEEFQKKGTALLLVSHDLETIKRICNRVVYIKNGMIEISGKSKDVSDYYEKDTQNNKSNDLITKDVKGSKYIYGNGKATIVDVWVEDQYGNKTSVLTSGEIYSIKYKLEVKEPVLSAGYSILIKTREGISVYGTNSAGKHQDGVMSLQSGSTYEVSFCIKNNLAPGFYHMNCGVFEDQGKEVNVFIHRLIDILTIKVIPGDDTTALVGVTDLFAKLDARGIDCEK